MYAPGEACWAGARLVDRVRRFTGVELPLDTRRSSLAPDVELVVVGTPDTSAVVASLMEKDPRSSDLGDEGYLLKIAAFEERQVLLAAGQTLAGANNAISEIDRTPCYSPS